MKQIRKHGEEYSLWYTWGQNANFNPKKDDPALVRQNKQETEETFGKIKGVYKLKFNALNIEN